MIYYYQSMHYNKHDVNMELVSEFVLWAEKIQLSVNLCMWHNTIIVN